MQVVDRLAIAWQDAERHSDEIERLHLDLASIEAPSFDELVLRVLVRLNNGDLAAEMRPDLAALIGYMTTKGRDVARRYV